MLEIRLIAKDVGSIDKFGHIDTTYRNNKFFKDLLTSDKSDSLLSDSGSVITKDESEEEDEGFGVQGVMSFAMAQSIHESVETSESFGVVETPDSPSQKSTHTSDSGALKTPGDSGIEVTAEDISSKVSQGTIESKDSDKELNTSLGHSRDKVDHSVDEVFDTNRPSNLFEEFSRGSEGNGLPNPFDHDEVKYDEVDPGAQFSWGLEIESVMADVKTPLGVLQNPVEESDVAKQAAWPVVESIKGVSAVEASASVINKDIDSKLSIIQNIQPPLPHASDLVEKEEGLRSIPESEQLDANFSVGTIDNRKSSEYDIKSKFRSDFMSDKVSALGNESGFKSNDDSLRDISASRIDIENDHKTKKTKHPDLTSSEADRVLGVAQPTSFRNSDTKPTFADFTANTPYSRETKEAIADQVTIGIKEHAKTGAKDLVINLHPAELGKVEIRMHISVDGKVEKIELTAQNKDTLGILLETTDKLTEGLKQVSSSDGASLSFNLKDGSHGRNQGQEKFSGFQNFFTGEDSKNDYGVRRSSFYEGSRGSHTGVLSIRV
jgi:hypothetical protein